MLNLNNQSHQEFLRVCRDLSTLGQKGHEYITIKPDKDGLNIPATTSKSNWLSRIFWKPDHLRFANVSDFIIKFININKELFAQDPDGYEALLHLRSRFNHKPELGKQINKIITDLDPLYQNTLIKINESKEKAQFELAAAIQERGLSHIVSAEIITTALRMASEQIERAGVSDAPPSYLDAVLSQSLASKKTITFACKDAEFVQADSSLLKAIKGSLFERAINASHNAFDLSMYPKKSVETLLNIVSGVKTHAGLPLRELMSLFTLAEKFSLNDLKADLTKQIRTVVNDHPEVILDALLYQYEDLPRNRFLENLLFAELVQNRWKLDFKPYLEVFQKFADANHPLPKTVLGICLCYGLGVKNDYKKAASLLTEAANQNFAPAQTQLGLCFQYGHEKNPAKAFSLFQKAADQNYSHGLCELGIGYFYGEGIKKDSTKAVTLFQKAVDQGSSFALSPLGFCYCQGIGVKKDLVKAINLFQNGANQGREAAQYNLARCYEDGIGVPQDYVKAVELYQMAAAKNDFPQAQEALKSLFKHR